MHSGYDSDSDLLGSDEDVKGFQPKNDVQRKDYYDRYSSFRKEIDGSHEYTFIRNTANKYELIVHLKPLSNGEILIINIRNKLYYPPPDNLIKGTK